MAQLTIAKTADDFDEHRMTAQRTPMAAIIGIRDIFIKFAGPPQDRSYLTSNIGNFRSFSFTDAQQAPSCEVKTP